MIAANQWIGIASRNARKLLCILFDRTKLAAKSTILPLSTRQWWDRYWYARSIHRFSLLRSHQDHRWINRDTRFSRKNDFYTYSPDGFEFDRIRKQSNWLMAMETLNGDIQSLDSDEISALSRRINMFARWSCVRATRFFLTDKTPGHEFKGYANLQIEITSCISRICVGESDACHRYPHYASAIRFFFSFSLLDIVRASSIVFGIQIG